MITRDAAHNYDYTIYGRKVRVPGVTTTLRVLDKSDWLGPWYARQTAEAAVRLAQAEDGGDDDGNPNTRNFTALDHLLDTVGAEGTIRALTSRSSWTRDEAAQLGTRVHGLAELVVSGKPTPPMPEAERVRVLHYAKWWQERLDEGCKLRLSEAMVVRPLDGEDEEHEGVPQTGWGGTFDLLYYDADGCTVLADIKTGGRWGRKAYDSEVLQVTAYGLARFVQPAVDNVMETPKVYPMPLIDKYKLIHVTAEGCKPIDVDITTRENMAYLACLDLYHWVESMKGKKL